MKRILSLLLCVLMVVSILPMSIFVVSAEGEELVEQQVYSNTFDNNTMAHTPVEGSGVTITVGDTADVYASGGRLLYKNSTKSSNYVNYQSTWDISIPYPENAKKLKLSMWIAGAFDKGGITAVKINGKQAVYGSVSGKNGTMRVKGSPEVTYSTTTHTAIKSTSGGVFLTYLYDLETGIADVTVQVNADGYEPKYTQIDLGTPQTPGFLVITTGVNQLKHSLYLDDLYLYAYVPEDVNVTPEYEVNVLVEGNTVDTQMVKEGEEYVLPEAPEKNNYTFVGWSDGTTTYAAGASVVITADTTFEAVYAINKHQVTVNANGETLETTEIEEGASYVLPTSAPAKEGYTFVEWTDGENAYQPGESVIITADITFTAVYEITKYQVTVNANGETVETAEVEKGASYVLPATAPEVDGYTFEGWTDGTNVYLAGESVVIVGNVTFEAIYEVFVPAAFYEVTVNADGETIATAEVEDGLTYKLPTAPAKVGYTFGGWACGEEVYNEGDEVVITANTTFTAVYEINQYQVTIGDETSTVDYGTEIVLPEAPAKEGYTFAGWVAGENTYDEGETVVVTADITFTATYTINQYQVTIGDETTTVDHGTEITIPAAPEKVGYTFVEWVSGENKYQAGATVVIIDNVTFEAVYQINKYQVTTIVDGVETTAELTYGAEYTVVAAPEKVGYTFVEWTDGENKYQAGNVITVTSAITLTAVYQINNYQVTVKVDDETLDTATVEHGATYTLPEAVEKEGFVFKGWSDGTTTYEAGAQVTILGNTEFVAVFGDLVEEQQIYFNDFSTTAKLNEGTYGNCTRVYNGRLYLDSGSGGQQNSGWARTVDLSGYSDAETFVISFLCSTNGARNGTAFAINGTSIVTVGGDEFKFNGKEYPVSDYPYVSNLTKGMIVYMVIDKATNTALVSLYNNGSQTPENLIASASVKIGTVGDTIKIHFGTSAYSKQSYDNLYVAAIVPVGYVPSYDVTVIANDVVVDTQEIVEGESYTLPAAPTKVNHTFKGWSDGTTTYEAGAEVVITADTTFTAVFERIKDTVSKEEYAHFTQNFNEDATAKGDLANANIGSVVENGALTVAPGDVNEWTAGAEAYPANSIVSFEFMLGALVAGEETLNLFGNLITVYAEGETNVFAVNEATVEIVADQWYTVIITMTAEGSVVYLDDDRIATTEFTLAGATEGLFTFTNDTEATVYYVDNINLSVKADEAFIQLTGYQKSDVDENGKYTVRFIAALEDVFDFQTIVGFDVVATEHGKSWLANETNTVYSSIKANYGQDTITADQAKPGAKYLTAIAIQGIPASLEAVALQITAYTIIDGVRYDAATVTVVVNPHYAE